MEARAAGKLYIVPTPIGNLEDITFRAVRILQEVDLILAEDTRTSSVLLHKYGIHTPMESHHKFNEHRQVEGIAERISMGLTVALISDAGTPGISDPGFLLSRACRLLSLEVECLPGPTAFVPALVNSALPAHRFCFEGFLPIKKGRATRLAELAKEERTMIFYESPFRLVKTLSQFSEQMGPDRRACVCRELSKIHEENRCDSLSELVQWYSVHQAKGEIVIVLQGRGDENTEED